MAIGRGTTPTVTITTSISLVDAAVIWLTYKQGSQIVFNKEKADLDITEQSISHTFSQEETLLLKYGPPVLIQIRARFEDGTAVKSNIMETTADKILKDGVI